MPDESMSSTAAKGKRLVLCFDGTGNKFLGNASDTNVVKIYQLLDRNDPNQYHYYQRESPDTRAANSLACASKVLTICSGHWHIHRA